MNKVLNLNVNQAKSFLNEADYENVKKEIVEAHKLLRAQPSSLSSLPCCCRLFLPRANAPVLRAASTT